MGRLPWYVTCFSTGVRDSKVSLTEDSFRAGTVETSTCLERGYWVCIETGGSCGFLSQVKDKCRGFEIRVLSYPGFPVRHVGKYKNTSVTFQEVHIEYLERFYLGLRHRDNKFTENSVPFQL